MQRAGRIVSGVLGGLVFLGAAGGTFWWLQSRSAMKEASPEVPLTQLPGAPATGPGQTPAGQQPSGSTPTPAVTSSWAPVALPAGSVKIEHGGSNVTLTEPGLVRFDVQTGETTVWHWPRTLNEYGATPGGEWAATKWQGDRSEGLLVHLPTGNAYRFKGELLWLGPEGALVRVDEGGRQRLILTDAQLKPQTERWLPDGFSATFDWQREESGWFRFWVRGASGTQTYHRFSVFTGAIESAGPPATKGLRLVQAPLFPAGCGESGGSLVKLYQGNQVLWTVLDAVTPMDYRFGGTRILADGQGALIGTKDGPTVLRAADGTLQAVPELKALGSSLLYASPASANLVAAAPRWAQDGSYLLNVKQIGQAGQPRTFSLLATTKEQGVGVTIDSGAYWSADGRYLQVAVNYPMAGGKCGGGDDDTTFLAPVVRKGEWKATLQVRTKAPTSLYAVTRESDTWKMGAPLRTVAAGERFTVKGISSYPKPMLVVEGDGILLADPSQLEWVP